jgi:hypothetical protein
MERQLELVLKCMLIGLSQFGMLCSSLLACFCYVTLPCTYLILLKLPKKSLSTYIGVFAFNVYLVFESRLSASSFWCLLSLTY